MTALGIYRHLSQASTRAGHFNILAIDHRGNLWTSLHKHNPSLSEADFIGFKRDVLRTLAPHASAVLTDPQFGVAPGIVEGFLSPSQGLLMPLELTDYDLPLDQRAINFIPSWSVAKLKHVGGSGVKLLVFYNPAAPDAAHKIRQIAQIIEECNAVQLPLYLEPIVYSLDSAQPLSNAERLRINVEAARRFSAMGAHILKLEFPLDVKAEPNPTHWGDALAELDAACAVPWALLSAGVDFETFALQAEAACKAGASGVIAGRAIWAEAVPLAGEARLAFLRTMGEARMKQLGGIVAAHAQSWQVRTATPNIQGEWWA
jgi:tagatose 1,6-diphosphate aldolase